jgi:hypothetical protein
MLSRTDAAGTSSYSYDAAGRLATLSDRDPPPVVHRGESVHGGPQPRHGQPGHRQGPPPDSPRRPSTGSWRFQTPVAP